MRRRRSRLSTSHSRTSSLKHLQHTRSYGSERNCFGGHLDRRHRRGQLVVRQADQAAKLSRNHRASDRGKRQAREENGGELERDRVLLDPARSLVSLAVPERQIDRGISWCPEPPSRSIGHVSR